MFALSPLPKNPSPWKRWNTVLTDLYFLSFLKNKQTNNNPPPKIDLVVNEARELKRPSNYAFSFVTVAFQDASACYRVRMLILTRTQKRNHRSNYALIKQNSFWAFLPHYSHSPQGHAGLRDLSSSFSQNCNLQPFLPDVLHPLTQWLSETFTEYDGQKHKRSGNLVSESMFWQMLLAATRYPNHFAIYPVVSALH